MLEQSRRWGGKLAPLELDGVRLDGGAESMLARRPEAVRRSPAELGLGAALVHPTAPGLALLVGGALHPMPPSLLGVPTDLAGLRGLLSPTGYRRGRRRARPPRAGARDRTRPSGPWSTSGSGRR